MRIDVVEIWFGIVNDQFLTELDARDRSVFSFPDDNFSTSQWIFTKLGVCNVIIKICYKIANGQISSIFDSVICPEHVSVFISGR